MCGLTRCGAELITLDYCIRHTAEQTALYMKRDGLLDSADSKSLSTHPCSSAWNITIPLERYHRGNNSTSTTVTQLAAVPCSDMHGYKASMSSAKQAPVIKSVHGSTTTLFRRRLQFYYLIDLGPLYTSGNQQRELAMQYDASLRLYAASATNGRASPLQRRHTRSNGRRRPVAVNLRRI